MKAPRTGRRTRTARRRSRLKSGNRGRASGSTKDFGPVRADYAYFEEHATEAAEDARTYAPHARSLANAKRSIRMLDFGCGEGTFTLRFLGATGLPSGSWSISLIEPDGVNRRAGCDPSRPDPGFSNFRIRKEIG